MASFNIADLTPDEVQSLAIIRKRKAHLLEEIQQIRAEMENVSAQIEALEPIEDEANPKAKQMLMGRKKFNMDPKRGMEYLIEQGLIQRTPQAVAEFLYKGEGLSGRYKSWKRRWFVLNDNCLYYFEYTTDKEPRGIIPLENVKVRQVEDKSRANTFEIYSNNSEFIKACKTEPDGRVVEGRHTVYRMSAATHEEMNMWIGAIE
ncbi:hypothetical protein QR680_002094 [Steinernema hermaphroditum]|uniref:PH domain-containing protein n=1 Tax=Steinernema hermaphroditum TaxID=289476 RepID=A0AA39H186_9BILA|nr:hypothetical protein QR680_002094 [Steinernema hermaphroditum]